MAFDPNPALGRVFENAANPASGDRVTMNGVVEKNSYHDWHTDSFGHRDMGVSSFLGFSA